MRIMNPMNWSFGQWSNFASIALTTLAGGVWWTNMMSPEWAAFSVGAVNYVNGLVNFVLTSPKTATV